jgi:hypothetical protein
MSSGLLMNTAMFLVVMKTTKQVQGLVYRKFLNLNIPSTNGYSLSNGDVKGMATATTMLVAVLPQPTNQHNHACGSTWHVPPGSLNTKMVSVRLENLILSPMIFIKKLSNRQPRPLELSPTIETQTRRFWYVRVGGVYI